MQMTIGGLTITPSTAILLLAHRRAYNRIIRPDKMSGAPDILSGLLFLRRRSD